MMKIEINNFIRRQASADADATSSSESTESTSIKGNTGNTGNTWRHAVMSSNPPTDRFTGADHGRDRLGLPDVDNPDDLEVE